MNDKQIVAFFIPASFDAALRMLRRALDSEGLCVAGEVDTSGRVREELGVGLKKSLVLYVDDPIRLLEATVMSPDGGLFIPEPVALTSLHASSCRVSIRSMEPLFSSDVPASLRRAVGNIHERILTALQRVGRKQTTASEMAGSDTALAPAIESGHRR